MSKPPVCQICRDPVDVSDPTVCTETKYFWKRDGNRFPVRMYWHDQCCVRLYCSKHGGRNRRIRADGGSVTRKIKLDIHVTERDIKIGTKGSCSKCPVALAVHRVIKLHPEYGVAKIGVESSEIEFRYDARDMRRPRGTYGYIYNVPARLKAFIRSFDGNKPVKPFRARLTILVLGE